MPVENLLSPDAVRRLCWTPPDPATVDAVSEVLRRLGARAWQIGLTAEVLAQALTAAVEAAARDSEQVHEAAPEAPLA